MNDAVTAMRKYPGRKISLSPGSRECQGLANSDIISTSTAIAASHGVESSDITTRKRENPKVTVDGGGRSAYHERQKVVLKIKSTEDGYCVRSSLKCLFPNLPCLDNIPEYSSWAVMIKTTCKSLHFLKPKNWGWPVDIGIRNTSFHCARDALVEYCKNDLFILQVCIVHETQGENSLHCIAIGRGILFDPDLGEFPLSLAAFQSATIIKVKRALKVIQF